MKSPVPLCLGGLTGIMLGFLEWDFYKPAAILVPKQHCQNTESEYYKHIVNYLHVLHV